MVYIIYIWAGRYMHIVDEVNWMLEVEECVRRVFRNGRGGVGWWGVGERVRAWKRTEGTGRISPGQPK
jgi:hypothetical protein